MQGGKEALSEDHERPDIVALVETMIKELRGPDGRPSSRERWLAVTKLQEARFWLGEDMMRS